MEKVGLVGTGLRSDILAHLLDRAGAEVRLWSPGDGRPENFPDAIESVGLQELADTPLVFICMPIHRIRETSRQLGDVLTGRHALVHSTRTVEYASLTAISEILEEETPTRRFGFITGPMRRNDVLEGRGASCVCASPFPEIADMVEEALHSEAFRVYRSEDLVGAEAAAAYARVIAFAYGMGDEMGLGKSLLSTLFARGLDEMSKFVTYQGGYEGTTFGLAGAGNLHADTTGAGNTDFRLGRRYVDQGAPELEQFRDDLSVVEDELFGFLESLISQAKTAHLDYQILGDLGRGLFEGEGLEVAFEWLDGRGDG
jgi:glycerol-3-phosphate dehydrogenase (NAD(P)+)